MLKDQIIFVAGGSGDIGQAVVEGCIKEKAQVIFSYYSSRTKAEAIYNKASKSGVDIEKIAMDITDPDSVSKIIDGIADKYGRLDGVVNCTGIHFASPLASMEAEHVTEQILVNLTGAIWLSQACAKIMIRQRHGSIIHFGSVSAHRMFRGHTVYSASKAGLEGLIKALAAELAKRQIRVNCIVPGPVDTNMLRSTRELFGEEALLARIPMGRFIKVEEIVKTVLFLLSDSATSITGTLIPVDGGYMLW